MDKPEYVVIRRDELENLVNGYSQDDIYLYTELADQLSGKGERHYKVEPVLNPDSANGRSNLRGLY